MDKLKKVGHTHVCPRDLIMSKPDLELISKLQSKLLRQGIYAMSIDEVVDLMNHQNERIKNLERSKMDNDVLKKLDRAIDKLNSISEAVADRTLWRPINTAPKDGNSILGFKNGVMATVRWMTVERYWTLCVPGTFTLYHDWDPSLWMPLPTGPKDGQ